MSKLGTKDLILTVSLELMNREGESNITAMDLANELDISPGNLYYHFKGKGEIIQALLERYDAAIHEAFRLEDIEQRQVVENWASLYVLMEEIYHYRFLFSNPNDILGRYPELSRALGRIYLKLYRYLDAVLQTVAQEAPPSFSVPTDVVALFMTNWLSYRELAIPGGDSRLFIRSGMARLEQLITPFCSDETRKAILLTNARYG